VPDTDRSRYYAARFGFTPGIVLLLGFCGLLVAVMLLLSVDPILNLLRGQPVLDFRWWLAIALGSLVFWGGGGLFVLGGVLHHRVALRADQHGVALGRDMYRETPPAVAWADIEAIVIFDQPAQRTGHSTYVGLRLRPDAALSREVPKPGIVVRAIIRLGYPYVSLPVAVRSLQVFGWRLDRHRLVDTVGSYAPHVAVLEIDRYGDQRTLRASSSA
jgi:hypothetical protein